MIVVKVKVEVGVKVKEFDEQRETDQDYQNVVVNHKDSDVKNDDCDDIILHLLAVVVLIQSPWNKVKSFRRNARRER